MRKTTPRGGIDRAEIGYTGTAARKGCKLIYTVSGRGMFPEDMLRYDSAFLPSGEVFSERLPTITPVVIHGDRCTPERWASFGWSVWNDILEVGV